MKLQTIVAALAIAATGVAHASVDQLDGGAVNGNSSLLFVALDSTGGTTQSLTIDLGLNFNQFANNGALTAANQKIVWDFNNNTITQNGAALTGITNAWAAQRDIFLANSDAAETKWAILAGSQKGNTPNQFLASGTPTAAQLTQQGGINTANFVQINAPLVNSLVTGNKGTIVSADNGAYAAASTDSSYVGTAYNLTTVKGWKNNIKWDTWSADGASTNLTQVNANGTELRLADSSTYVVGPDEVLDASNTLGGYGTFKYDAALGQLTYQTATITAVPEPESYALALVGLIGMGFVARRRAAK